MHVVKIEPEKVRPFEEVAPELKQRLAIERAKAEILSIYDKIEDERSNGKSLAEAAAEAQARRPHRRGRPLRPRSDGQPVTDLPDAAAPADGGIHHRGRRRDRSAAGAGRLHLVRGRGHHTGARSHPRRGEGPGRGALARGRDRDAPEGQGGADARQAQGRNDAGGAAAADGLKVETKSGIKRGAASPPLSAAAIDKIFRTAKDAAASAEAEQPAEQVVFRVTDIVVPKLDIELERGQASRRTLNTLADRRHLQRNTLPSSRARSASPSIRTRCARWSPAAATRRPTTPTSISELGDADRAAGERLRQTLCARRGAGRLDHAGRRSRDAGLGLSQDRRRPAA